MNGPELIRIVDSIARDKNIEKEAIYVDIEQAIASGLRKQYDTEDTSEFQVTLDRLNGSIMMLRNGEKLPENVMGRIGAQTVKQVMIQLIRQDERGSIYEEYKDRVGTIITGTVARQEGNTLIVTLGRNIEGIMPRSEQIPSEQHAPGERVQALITEVRDTPSSVKIILSRSHPELIRRLFEREVPEVGERTIEIKALAREPGKRTKLAVSSIDSKVDAVGACVGVRGSRIKNIVEELGGEKIDIVRWNESSQILIANSLKPAEVAEVSLCFELGRATVIVNEDQLSLAIGKHGQNVRLAARLTGWDVDILTPAEYQSNVERLERTLLSVEGVTQEHVDRVIALGLIDVRDIEEVDTTPLTDEAGMEDDLAIAVVERCTDEARLAAAEAEAKKATEAAARRSGASGGTSARVASLEAALAAPDAAVVDSADEETGENEIDNRQPGPFEAAAGGSPETITHSERDTNTRRSDLSPEERAMHLEVPSNETGDTDDDELSPTRGVRENRGVDSPEAHVGMALNHELRDGEEPDPQQLPPDYRDDDPDLAAGAPDTSQEGLQDAGVHPADANDDMADSPVEQNSLSAGLSETDPIEAPAGTGEPGPGKGDGLS